MARAFSGLAPPEASTKWGPFGLDSQSRRTRRDTVWSTSFSRGLVKERVLKYTFVKLVSSNIIGDSNTTDHGLPETNKSVVLTGVPWSGGLGLMPLCYATASSKALLLGWGLLCSVPLIKSYLLLWEGRCLTDYGAITTWGSVFSNPSPKPSRTVQPGDVLS